jgi:hypothetical protein
MMNHPKAHLGKKIENLLPYAPQIEGPKGQVTGWKKSEGVNYHDLNIHPLTKYPT